MLVVVVVARWFDRVDRAVTVVAPSVSPVAVVVGWCGARACRPAHNHEPDPWPGSSASLAWPSLALAQLLPDWLQPWLFSPSQPGPSLT
jgi:hypothetical protein